VRAFIKAGGASTDRGTDQRSLLAVDESADASAGTGAPADDERRLSPRPMASRGAVAYDVVCAVDGRPVRATTNACDVRDNLAAHERVANDGVLAGPACHEDWSGPRLTAAGTNQ
jgi:hypothetical protein